MWADDARRSFPRGKWIARGIWFREITTRYWWMFESVDGDRGLFVNVAFIVAVAFTGVYFVGS